MSQNQRSLVTRPYVSRRTRACKQCRAAKVRCSGGRPCERCARRSDPCAFATDENYVSVPEHYLRDLQRQLSESQTPIRAQTRNQRGARSSPDMTRDRSQSSSGVAESASGPNLNPNTYSPSRQAFPPGASASADLMSTITVSNVPNNPATSTTPSRAPRDPLLANNPGNSEFSIGGRRSQALTDKTNVSGPFRKVLVRNEFAYVRNTNTSRLLFLGRTSTFTFCLRAFDVLENTEHCHNTPPAPLHFDGSAFRLQWQAKSTVDAEDLLNLPPMDKALFLYHTVKFRLGELFRMIDEPRFLGLFEDFHKLSLQTAREHQLWFVEYLLLLAFGKALTPSRGPALNGPPGCELAARALSLLPDVAFLQDERPATQAIEVLSLAALYFFAIDMRSPAYQYIGQALRLALHDGLHRCVPDDVAPGLIAACHNAWWGVYVLDQEITASLGCPSAVSQDEITTPLPDVLSSEVSATVLSLRTRLSRLVSNITSFTYGLDVDLGSEFILNTTTILHSLAELSRDIDEITSAYKIGGGEPPHMFYNIMLSHHHCIVLATRPLVIWLLLRSVSSDDFEPRLLTGPVATLVEKSAQSATKTLLTLKDLADRDALEVFLPFQLEYAFASAILLCILSVFLPQFVPNHDWRYAATSIFEAMIIKGSVVAGLRMAELEHLETLLSHHKPSNQMRSRPTEPFPQNTSADEQSRVSSQDLALSHDDDRQLQHGLTSGRDDTQGDIDIFDITADEILALAQEFEHDNPSEWVIFDEQI